MLPQIERYLLESWNLFFDRRPHQLSSMLLSNPQNKKNVTSKCTVLIFIDQEQEPRLVAKFSRNRNNQKKVINEQHLLERLTLTMTPRSFGLHDINGRKVSFEQFMKGKSVKQKLKYNIHQVFQNTLDDPDLRLTISQDFELFSAFYSAFLNQAGTFKQVSESYIDRSLERLEHHIHELDLESDFIDIANVMKLEYMESLRHTSINLSHLDMTPSNLIVQDGEMVCIDFEFSAFSQHANIDPIRFLFYYFHELHDNGVLPYGSYEANFIYFFKEDEWLQSVVTEHLSHTLSSVNPNKELWNLLFVLLIGNVQLQKEELNYIHEDFILNSKKLIEIVCGLKLGLDIHSQQYNKDSFNTRAHQVKSKYELIEDLHQSALKEKQYLKDIEHRDTLLLKNHGYIKLCQDTIESKDEQLGRNVKYIEQCHSTIELRDRQLAEKELLIAELQLRISKLETGLVSKFGRFRRKLSAIKKKYGSKERRP
ncbi:hypothetical protein [Cohnella hashimotonis]|uniref:Aminoglycoside phosphotransferase domain-containing protein n=1 Tax=Cohnella hashimotonis TaxID=2826895 RepID=A0ABT6TTW3_9BACL|nr:hypothetical protein [Cohnella hashimotonis]MDI4650297.1 hypothetical protein [Cohnella hashimotonis]